MPTNVHSGSEHFGTFLCGFLGGGVCALLSAKSYLSTKPLTHEMAMPYADVVVIVLTCVTVVITCAALVIGMLGVFGFKLIKEEAEKSSVMASVQASKENAVLAALEVVEKEMKEGGVLTKMLESRADIILSTYNRSRIPAEEWGDQKLDHGDK